MDEVKPNILYLSYDGMTDPLGQSQVLPYLKGISKAGYNVHLVSYEKADKFLKHQKFIQQICDEAGIHWHPQDYVLGGGLRSTLRQVFRMRKIAFYLHDKYRFQIVHCRSYIAALSGLALKKKKNVKFIFDMRGFWADERVDGGLWDLKNPLYKMIYSYFKRKEIQFFKEADYSISLTENGKSEILSWKELKSSPPEIEVIPCCVDLDLFDPNSTNSQDKRSALGISDDTFVLGYVGSIGTWYMLPEMLDYFKSLLENRPDARFLFVTGESPSKIESLAESKGISKDHLIIHSALHKDVPAYISIMNMSIFFIRSSYSKKASSPTKQGEIMAMGIPLVCNSGIGDTDEIVRKYHAGTVIDSFNQESYKEAIHSSKKENTKEIIHGAYEYFSLDEGVKKYLKVYKSISE